jgi:hypothetical protein
MNMFALVGAIMARFIIPAPSFPDLSTTWLAFTATSR